MDLKVEKIDFPTDHLCVCIVRCQLTYTVGNEERVNNTVITCLLEKHGVEWQIRNFQNTSFRPY
jgi:hypothetical protein